MTPVMVCHDALLRVVISLARYPVRLEQPSPYGGNKLCELARAGDGPQHVLLAVVACQVLILARRAGQPDRTARYPVPSRCPHSEHREPPAGGAPIANDEKASVVLRRWRWLQAARRMDQCPHHRKPELVAPNRRRIGRALIAPAGLLSSRYTGGQRRLNCW